MSLPMLAHDKANHVIYGALIFMAGAALALLFLSPAYARCVGGAAAAAAAVLKELADWRRNEHDMAQGFPPSRGAESADALATVAGALAVWLAVEILS